MRSGAWRKGEIINAVNEIRSDERRHADFVTKALERERRQMAARGIASYYIWRFEFCLIRSAEPTRRGKHVIGTSGKRIFRRKPILRSDDRYFCFPAQLPKKRRIILRPLGDPSPTVNVEISSSRYARGMEHQEPDARAA